MGILSSLSIILAGGNKTPLGKNPLRKNDQWLTVLILIADGIVITSNLFSIILTLPIHLSLLEEVLPNSF